jgi:hypothetical protein
MSSEKPPNTLNKKENVPIPENAPKIGEIYRYYKEGHEYTVSDISLSVKDQKYVVVYKPLYECSIKSFNRFLDEWNEEVEYNGELVKRFTKIK